MQTDIRTRFQIIQDLHNAECAKTKQNIFLEQLFQAIAVLYQDGEYSFIENMSIVCKYKQDQFFNYSFILNKDVFYLKYFNNKIKELFHFSKKDLSDRTKIQLCLNEVHKINNLRYLYIVYHSLTNKYPELNLQFEFESDNLLDKKYIVIDELNLEFIIYPKDDFKIIMKKNNNDTILINKNCHYLTMFDQLSNQIDIHISSLQNDDNNNSNKQN